MRPTPLLLALAASALAAPAPSPKKQFAELKAALEAHMDGDDAKARVHLGACIKADPDSVDAAGCSIYLEWWGEGVKQVDKPSKPEARKAYSVGVEAYKRGDLPLARAAWRRCLDESADDTAVRHDCMAMMDLVPKPGVPAEEAEIRKVYMEGFMHYGKGETARAREKWLLCLDRAPKGGPTHSDCRTGLEKLEAESRKR